MSTRTKHIRHAATAFCMLALSPLLLPAAGQSVEEGYTAFEAGDYATALENFKPLAEQGDAHAQFNLGVMYDKGQGVAQDYAEAARWYRRAAGLGDANAQFRLGFMYMDGQGVRQDHATAYMWGDIAAANGAPPDLRDLVAWLMSTEEHVQAHRRARVCMESNYQDCD